MSPAIAKPTVRAATPDDFTRVGALSVDAYGHAGVLAGGYDAVLLDVAARTEGGLLLVAELDGRIVGSVTLLDEPGPQSQVLREPGELEFRQLAVDPQAQDAGIGAVLIDAVLGHAARAGKHRVVLALLSRNVRAGGMYERRGFVRLPDRDLAPAPDVDLYAMGLDLPQVCTRCGTHVVNGLEDDGSVHVHREPGSDLDPPRFCPVCARRLVVQVLPRGWTAGCSRHGDLSPLPDDDL